MTYLQNFFRISNKELFDVLDSMTDFDRRMARKANEGDQLARALYDSAFEKNVNVIVAKRASQSRATGDAPFPPHPQGDEVSKEALS